MSYAGDRPQSGSGSGSGGSLTSPSNTIKGNNTGVESNTLDLTPNEALALINGLNKNNNLNDLENKSVARANLLDSASYPLGCFLTKNSSGASFISNYRLMYSNIFNGSSTVYLFQDEHISMRFDGANKQFQYKIISSGWDWYDAGIVIHKNGSMISSTDDISATANTWYYFTANGALNTNFNLGTYAFFGTAHVTKETITSTDKPSYYLTYTSGTSTSVSAKIERIGV